MDAHILFFQGRVCVLISFCTYISKKLNTFGKEVGLGEGGVTIQGKSV
jgi:hypothetical protein